MTKKQLCLYHNSLAKERDKPMRAEDDEMSNALMNDMADALRSAGLGSMIHSDEVEPEPESEPETPSEILVEAEDEPEKSTISDEELTVEEQVQSLIEEGEYKSRSNAPQEALVAFNKAIALDPSSDMAWFNRGVLLEAQQDARGARQAFQICLDLNPDHAPATANLAILLDRIGDDAGAAAMARRGLEFFPGHPSLTDVLNRTKSAPVEEVPDEIETTVTKATHQESTLNVVMEETGVEDAEAILAEAAHHDLDGDGHLDKEELKSAAGIVAATQIVEEQIEETIEAEIQDRPVVEEINLDKLTDEATELIRQGEPKKALALLKPHLKTIGAQHAGAWRIAGGAMARMELDTHAIAALEHATKLDETVASGWYNLGSLYARNENQTGAVEAFEKTVELDARHIKARRKLVDFARTENDVGTVLSQGMQILEHQDDPDLRNEIIQSLLQCGETEVEVLEYITGIPPTMPEAPQLAQYALDLLSPGASVDRARALTLKGENIEAVTVWKELIQHDKENASLWRGLAKSLEAAGDLETAQRCHTKARDLESPPQPETEEISQQQFETPPPPPTATPPPFAPEPPAMVSEPVQALPIEQQTIVEGQVTSAANDLLLTPVEPVSKTVTEEVNVEVDLAKAALDATSMVQVNPIVTANSSSVANQDISWYNQGIQLMEDGKYREALSSFDRALPSFAHDNQMVIRILNGRGNAYYFLEEYPACVESYHKAMMIDPSNVRGQTLYNMGTAYAEMERFPDAIKCYEQSIPRGLSDEEAKRAKEQIRRCTILEKERKKKLMRR
ncbi:MAG: tetratricopeptide repeat protein [Candidatus Thermoplasmatota archaeon]|nr:tetratricopeptide repeat protein [Candidatus Thermoplasmatota archaeon]